MQTGVMWKGWRARLTLSVRKKRNCQSRVLAFDCFIKVPLPFRSKSSRPPTLIVDGDWSFSLKVLQLVPKRRSKAWEKMTANVRAKSSVLSTLLASWRSALIYGYLTGVCSQWFSVEAHDSFFIKKRLWLKLAPNIPILYPATICALKAIVQAHVFSTTDPAIDKIFTAPGLLKNSALDAVNWVSNSHQVCNKFPIVAFHAQKWELCTCKCVAGCVK